MTIHKLNAGYSATESAAKLFEVLLDLSRPIVSHYQSDLYYDAQWLRVNFTEMPFEFVYGVRPYGTHIGPLSSLKTFQSMGASDLKLYHIRVVVVSGWNVARVEEIS